MNIKSFTALTTLAASVAVTTAPMAQASPYAVDSAHNQLITAIRSTGIQFIVNGEWCAKDKFHGYYWAAKNEMVICQDARNRRNRSQHEVRWSANDLDTLRHEAQHLIQDCMVGSYRDGKLGAVYKDPIGLAKNILGTKSIYSILKAYSDKSDHTKVMELEAFSVAAMNNPMDQVADIKKFCF